MMHPFLLAILSLVLFTQCNSKQVSEQSTPTLYQEPHRNQFHFSPDSMWMNDPNGMVYYEGEYHLFYQYYPDSTVWGPMHWGHAVSKDLVHWEHLPIALYPDELGYIFSGSAVIDWNNTSGFGDGETPPMIAIFTHHNSEGERAGAIDFQYQSIAYSLDKGRSWTKYAGNPVVPNPGIKDFRDPKVVWDENSQQWVMVFAAWDHVKLYGSPNLKDWTHLSDFGREWGSHAGVWECPDFFPIALEGTDDQRWLMIVSVQAGSPNGGTGAQYFVGDFNGQEFVLSDDFVAAVRPAEVLNEQRINRDEKTVWVDHGRDNYAGVTWSDVPASDGRRLFIGWMSNWQYALQVPTERWRSAMTLPRELSLIRTSAGPRLAAQPVRELQMLRQEELFWSPEETGGLLSGTAVNQQEWILEFDPLAQPTISEVYLELSNSAGERLLIGYEVESQRFFTDRTITQLADFQAGFATQRHYAPRAPDQAAKIRMHLFLDHASVELFADEGQTVLTDIYFAKSPFTTARLFADGGVWQTNPQVFPLASIWR
ncbi:MAG: glycoside hydrolase family 32 protein [Bacteroidota bacterium]